MENMTLYNITNRFIDLFNKEDLTEEEMQEQGQELAKLLQNKSESIVAVDMQYKSNIEMIDNEIERLSKLRDKIKVKEEKFKDYVKYNMEQLNLDKIDTALGTLSIRNNPPKVDIYDENAISEEFYIEKTTKSLSKTLIKEKLKKGEEVKGARLISEKSLSIS